MKRVMKNVILFAAMFVAVGMLTLTILHGYGIIGGTGNGAISGDGFPGGASNDFEGFGRPDGNNASDDGEEIGEVTLPDGGNSGSAPSDGNGQGMTPPDGNGQNQDMTPPQMPGGNGFGGFDNAGDGNKAPAGAGNSLGGHLAFAAVWVFLFAFCLSWAIYSRCNSETAGRKGGDGQWKSEPASNGTN